jgi:hypothetical protein
MYRGEIHEHFPLNCHDDYVRTINIFWEIHDGNKLDKIVLNIERCCYLDVSEELT